MFRQAARKSLSGRQMYRQAHAGRQVHRRADIQMYRYTDAQTLTERQILIRELTVRQGIPAGRQILVRKLTVRQDT